MKKITMKESFRFQVLVIALAVISGFGSLMTPVTARAAGFDGWSFYDGQNLSEGYFSNGGASDASSAVRCDSASGRCPVLPNNDYKPGAPFYGEALSSSYYRNESISSADRAFVLHNHLKTKAKSGSAWERAGAAFIANTMLGRGIDDPAKTRNISDADWDKLGKFLIEAAYDGRIEWSSWISSDYRDTMMHRINGQYDVVYNTTLESRVGLIIKNKDSSIAYRMWYECANPIGNFVGFREPTDWSISGQSYIKNAGNSSSPNWAKEGSQTGLLSEPAVPGDWIGWYHDLRNNGPSNMSSIYFQTEKTGGFPASYNTQPQGSASGAPGSLFVHEYANYSKPTTSQLRYRIQDSDVGKTLCQRIIWLPGSSSYGSWQGAAGGGACVKVERNFNLVPSIKDTPGVVEPGTEVTITPEVNNTGKTSSDPNAQWQLVKVTVPKGSGGIPRVDDTTRSTPGSPCPSYYGSRCEVIDSHSGTKPGGFTTGVTKDLPEYPYNVGDLEVGDRICFGLSVRPQSNESGNWRHSTLKCVTVGKRPSVNVVGGDVIVGRASGKQDIVTSLTAKKIDGEDRIFGSWGEYALIADGRILGMASAAGLAGSNGKAGSSINMCQVSYLTITNAGTGSSCDENKLGNYATGNGAPPISSGFPTGTTALSGTRSIDSIPGSKDTYRVNDGATLTISGGPVQRGKSVVINAPRSNVVISGNINYDGGEIASITDIPQVVIIANTITINENVTNVDAWLIASGEAGVINTCNSVTAFGDLDANKCTNRLTVNGPVLANKLNLYRTAGSGKASESRQPAETFNLRPDAYLWATGYRNGSSFRLQTENTIELPPRY